MNPDEIIAEHTLGKVEVSEEEIEAYRGEDIGMYYKYVNKCKVCGKKYGSDFIEKVKLCPYCDKSFKR